MSKDHFHYATIDFKELRNELLASNKDIELLRGDVYLAEMGQHHELKTFFDALFQNKGPISIKERTEFFQSLVSSVAASRPISQDELPDLLKYPPSARSLAYLEEAKNRSTGLRELASVAAEAAFLVAGETKSREEIQVGVKEKYSGFLANIEEQLDKDISRSVCSIRKNGNTHKIGTYPGMTNTRFQEAIGMLNEEKSLGLTREQIGYIACSTDQFIKGAGMTWQTGTYIKENRILSEGEQAFLVNIGKTENGIQSVNILINSENKIAKLDENFGFIEGPNGKDGTSCKTITSDISNLLSKKPFSPGLGSAEVPTKLSILTLGSSVNLNPPLEVQTDQIGDNPALYFAVKLAARDDLNTKDKLLEYISNETAKELLHYTVQGLADFGVIKKEEIKDVFIASSLSMAKKTGKKIDLKEESERLVMCIGSDRISVVDSYKEIRAAAKDQNLATTENLVDRFFSPVSSRSRANTPDSDSNTTSENRSRAGSIFEAMKSPENFLFGSPSARRNSTDRSRTPGESSSFSASSNESGKTSRATSRTNSFDSDWASKILSKNKSPSSSNKR